MFQFTHPGGVRLRFSLTSLIAMCFNSRTREGCDALEAFSGYRAFQFQFTHPGGVRLRDNADQLGITLSFNSRTREGCDLAGDDFTERQGGVSIHAPGRGATPPP